MPRAPAQSMDSTTGCSVCCERFATVARLRGDSDEGPQGRGPYVLMYALDRNDPVALAGTEKHPVLVAMRTTPWHPLHRELLQQATAQVSRLQAPATWRTEHAELTRSRSAIRQSAIQALMSGNVAAAESVLSPVLPDLLTGEWMRIGVLRCAPDQDREAIRGECEQLLSGRALVASCLDKTNDILILTPEGSHAEGPSLGGTLLPVRERHRLLLGISAPVAWRHAALGYHSGVEALSSAHLEPDRSAVADCIDASGPLTQRLQPWSRAWAASVLHAPLARIPEEERRELVHIATVALTLGPVQAAQLLRSVEAAGAIRGGREPRGWIADRNQVADRLQRLGDEVGLRDTRLDRAVLYLALGLDAAARSGGPVQEISASPTLEQVLNSFEAVSWAQGVLAPLSEQQRRVLTTWLLHGTETAAEAERTSERTIRNRLRRIGDTLGRSLTGAPAELYEVVLALAIAGDLTLSDPGRHTSRADEELTEASSYTGPPPRWSGWINACRDGVHYYPHEGELLRQVDEHLPAKCLEWSAHFYRERVVRWGAGEGIRQYLHIGCGLPLQPHLHQWAPPGSRWVNAEADPVARMYLQELIPSFTTHYVGCMDLNPADPEAMLETLAQDHAFDLDEPLGIVYGETNPVLSQLLISRTVKHLAARSFLSINKLAENDDAGFQTAMKIMTDAGLPYAPCTEDEMAALIDGLDPVEPGIVTHDAWRPSWRFPTKAVPPCPTSAGTSS